MAEEQPAGSKVEQKSTTSANTVTVEDIGPCKKKVSIEIPEQTIRNATDEQYNTLRKEIVLPGFRKGRAPRRLLEKRFGKETSEQVKLKLLADASESAIKDQKLDVLGDPDIDFEKIELPAQGALKFGFEVEVSPQFELPPLEGIAVKKTKMTVDDEQIDKELEHLRKTSGVWTPRDKGPVELYDEVVGDIVAKVEGVESETKLDNAEIYVRPNGFVWMIPVEKLDELLVGAEAGQTKQTTVEVPKTYFKEEYRGKKVDLQITVKDIKLLKPAELDAVFLKKYNTDSENELREKIRNALQNDLEERVRNDMSEQVFKHLLDNTSFDLPLDVVAKQATNVLRRQYVGLLAKGLPREEIDQQMEQLRASSEEQAKGQLKTFFIMDKVAEKLAIEVSEEEINGHIAQVALRRGQRPEKLRENMERDGSLAQFRLEVRQDKCIAKLLESAIIEEVQPEKTAKKPAKTAKKTAKKPAKG